MNRIKIAGALVFILSLFLAFISVHIANKNRVNLSTLSLFSEQKTSIQEISKSIFYTYRNGATSSTNLDKHLDYLNSQKRDKFNLKSEQLWNAFSVDVQKFKTQQRVATGYNPIITAKLVNSIYHKNVILLNELDKLIELKELETHSDIKIYRELQYLLFFLLIGLLFYLFTQLHFVLEFIQKFSKTSKKIIKNSTIKGVESIEITSSSHELKEASKNYNHMVKQINLSIENSTNSMTQSIKSLENVVQNIENFMELLYTMEDKESDELFQKEDAIIDSLETLMRLQKRLNDLKIELNKLS
jgi:methyl-accepting chemotaxis protein